MNIKFAALLAAAALSVAACEQQAATPQQASTVPAADTASATSADAPSAPPAAAPQTLTSSDNAVSISVTGNFQDQLGGNALPEGAEAGTILQQYDENTDITLTVVDAGKPVKPAKEYYANLKTALEQAGFANLKAGAATENRMDYSFTDAEGNDRMREKIQENYNRIKAEVKQIVKDELERIKNDESLSHLLPKSQ